MSRIPRVHFDESKRQPDGRLDPYGTYPALVRMRNDDVRVRYGEGVVDGLTRELVRLKNAYYTQCDI